MRVIALCAAALSVVAYAQTPTLEIVVGASAATPNFHPTTPEPNPKPGKLQFGEFNNPHTFAAFLGPEVITKIVVDAYDPEAYSWGAKAPWSPESLKAEMFAMRTARMEGPSTRIMWSEGNIWSVAATITFQSGKKGKLLADGLHVFYEDPEGYRWFFRVQKEK